MGYHGWKPRPGHDGQTFEGRHRVVDAQREEQAAGRAPGAKHNELGLETGGKSRGKHGKKTAEN